MTSRQWEGMGTVKVIPAGTPVVLRDKCCCCLWSCRPIVLARLFVLVCLQEVPPYNFHGSLDDSLQNLRKVVPVPPRRDYVKYMDNIGKLLRYEAQLVLNSSMHVLYISPLYPCGLTVASLASAAFVAYLLAYFSCVACVKYSRALTSDVVA